MKPRTDKTGSTRWSLIQRLRQWDDEEGWREFFESYWRLIYGTAMRSGLTDAEAQDVVQETIIAVCRNIKHLDLVPGAGSFKNWLMRMAKWRIIDEIRKRPQRGALMLQEKPGDGTALDEQWLDPAGPELERIWEEEWRGNLMEAALAKVRRQTNARHFQIFHLYVVRQIPAAQVAAATGATLDEVYMVKHRLVPLLERAIKAVEAFERA